MQRSNTLPKSFGSQLEKEDEKKQELVDKAIKPSVEATLGIHPEEAPGEAGRDQPSGRH